MAKLNFQQLILQSSVSHDPLEIDLLLEKHFLLLSKLKKVVFTDKSFVYSERHMNMMWHRCYASQPPKA